MKFGCFWQKISHKDGVETIPKVLYRKRRKRMAADKNLYFIGNVAKLTSLSHQALRYYDSIKLIVPQNRDSSSGYRYYTEQQVILLMIIRRLRDSRCSLEDIRMIVNEKRLDKLYELLDRQNRKLEHEIAHIQSIIHKNGELINRLY
ncbi:MAG: MerR family transcriptional regulator [Lachnospiraceae bacterium]|nr:MerR family transcriptional regulator [Lachnospiraceae bacterium]